MDKKIYLFKVMLSIVTFNINGGKKLLDSFFETNIENKSDENQKIKRY